MVVSDHAVPRGARSHWMWYIFPQLDGLGLLKCADTVHKIEGKTASEIFGYPDNLKLKSSMTLFSQVADDSVFVRVLDKYFQSERDTKTLQLLEKLKHTK